MSRKTMIDNHTRAAEHAVVSATFHKAMEQHFGALADAMSKAQADGPVEVLQSIGQEHAAMADAHTADAEYHVQCCKNLSATHKSMMNDDDELVPTEVSIVTPGAPMNRGVRAEVRAVPRYGAPQAASVPDVSPEFQKLFSIDEN
jgi:hypothetical protein